MNKLSLWDALWDFLSAWFSNKLLNFLTKCSALTLLLFAWLVLDKAVVLAVTPNFDNAYLIGAAGFEITSIAVGDLNGDGAFDVVTGSREGNSISIDYGNSDFADTSFDYIGRVTGVKLSDMNGDGLLDIIVGLVGPQEQQNAIYLNIGDEKFSTAILFGSSIAGKIEVGDLNGDGFIDIVSNSLGQGYLHFNDGTGHITTTVILGSAAGPLALGDLDGNGALDIVVGEVSGRIGIYLNNGDGKFTTPTLVGASVKALTLERVMHFPNLDGLSILNG